VTEYGERTGDDVYTFNDGESAGPDGGGDPDLVGPREKRYRTLSHLQPGRYQRGLRDANLMSYELTTGRRFASRRFAPYTNQLSSFAVVELYGRQAWGSRHSIRKSLGPGLR
jgi:hypothetical protein